MGFAVIPLNSGPPVDAYSFPNAVSICVFDDGSGGQVLFNGLGIVDPVVTGAVDLRGYFGAANFKSLPLLRAFRVLANGTQAAAETQLITNLDVSIVSLNNLPPTRTPGLLYLANLSPVPNVPFLAVNGPGVAGSWRVEIKLRHSITD